MAGWYRLKVCVWTVGVHDYSETSVWVCSGNWLICYRKYMWSFTLYNLVWCYPVAQLTQNMFLHLHTESEIFVCVFSYSSKCQNVCYGCKNLIFYDGRKFRRLYSQREVVLPFSECLFKLSANGPPCWQRLFTLTPPTMCDWDSQQCKNTLHQFQWRRW